MMLSQEAIDAYKEIGKILVMWQSKNHEIMATGFNTVKEAAEYIEASPGFIIKVLNGKNIHGEIWRPNIYFKPVSETKVIKYLVVYTEDWINYSDRQRKSRINKLIYQNI